MSSSNRLATSTSSSFFPDDQVDDDAFLRHPRHGSDGYMFPTASATSTGGQGGDSGHLASRHEQLVAERKRLEQSALETSKRCVGTVIDTEQVGLQTAEDLVRQREQLEKTENRLDDINSSLNTSQKHLNNIKSVFSSLRSYFGGRNSSAINSPANTINEVEHPGTTKPSSSQLRTVVDKMDSGGIGGGGGGGCGFSEHPSLTARGVSENKKPLFDRDPTSEEVDMRLDQNLDDVCSGLSRLRGLATGLHTEITEQNQMLDRITDKTERADIRVNKQNQEMNRLLTK
nr:SNAP29-like protein [Parasacculina yatsui]